MSVCMPFIRMVDFIGRTTQGAAQDCDYNDLCSLPKRKAKVYPCYGVKGDKKINKPDHGEGAVVSGSSIR